MNKSENSGYYYHLPKDTTLLELDLVKRILRKPTKKIHLKVSLHLDT